MNPLTNVRNQNKINQRELELGYTGTKNSWHNKYKDSAWLFIGGLPYDLTEGDVLCIFSQYGEIVNINLVRDKSSGKSKGFCFLCYEDQRSTILAVDNFNGAKILGRIIRVDHVENYRKPKEGEEEDEITRLLREHGCAPQAPPLPTQAPPRPTHAPPRPTQAPLEATTSTAHDIKSEKKAKKKKIKKEKKKKKEKSKQESCDSDSSSSESEDASAHNRNGRVRVKQEVEERASQHRNTVKTEPLSPPHRGTDRRKPDAIHDGTDRRKPDAIHDRRRHEEEGSRSHRSPQTSRRDSLSPERNRHRKRKESLSPQRRPRKYSSSPERRQSKQKSHRRSRSRSRSPDRHSKSDRYRR